MASNDSIIEWHSMCGDEDPVFWVSALWKREYYTITLTFGGVYKEYSTPTRGCTPRGFAQGCTTPEGVEFSCTSRPNISVMVDPISF